VTHPIDAGLRSLGIDPDTLAPDVLAALRTAAPPSTADQFAAAFEAALADDPTDRLLADIANAQENDRG
jgi:hypothetical protein